jgi:hypothetical protein
VPRFDAIHADTAAELPLVSSGMTSPFSRAIFYTWSGQIYFDPQI